MRTLGGYLGCFFVFMADIFRFQRLYGYGTGRGADDGLPFNAELQQSILGNGPG